MLDPRQSLTPTPAGQRLASLDLLRGFALCGILLVNIMPMGGPWAGYHPPLPADLARPDWWAWIIQHLFLQGAMRGLFTLLFGAGVLLITLRGREGEGREGGGSIQAADVYFRRCLALLALGVFNAVVLLFPGDILYVYGLSGLLLFVFRAARPRVLIGLAAALLLLLTAETALVGARTAQLARQGGELVAAAQAGQPLSPNERRAVEAYQEALEARSASSPAAVEEAAIRTGGAVGLLRWSARTWLDYAASSYTIGLVAETVAFMLLGMALFKLGVLGGGRSLGFYAALAAGGYAVGLAVNGAQVVGLLRSQFSLATWTIGAGYELGRCGITLGHVGLVLALWKARALGGVEGALRNLGRMALTNYLGQSAIAGLLFYGLGLWGRLGWWGLWGVAVAIWAVQMVFSTLWLRAFAMGPLEWGLRWLAYGRPSPLRRRG